MSKPECKASRVVLCHDATNGGRGHFYTNEDHFHGYRPDQHLQWVASDRGLFHRHLWHRPMGSKDGKYNFTCAYDAMMDPAAAPMFAGFVNEIISYLEADPNNEIEIYTGRMNDSDTQNEIAVLYEVEYWARISDRFGDRFTWTLDAAGGRAVDIDHPTYAVARQHMVNRNISYGVEPIPPSNYDHWRGARVVQLDHMLRDQVEDRWRGWMSPMYLGQILTCFTGHDSQNSVDDDIQYCIDKIVPLGDQFEIGIPVYQIERWMDKIIFVP